ncbi:hypothetical protein Ancab_010945 [Ancistrocladus abbreviatus]
MIGFLSLRFPHKRIKHKEFRVLSLTNYLHTAGTIAPQLPDPTLRPPLASSQCGSILQSLTNSKSLEEGKSLHAHMISSGILINNTYISTKLTAFYANCGHMDKAQIIFDKIVLKNLFLWNFMVRGYVSNGYPLKGVLLYREMLRLGQKPDKFTFPFVLKACGDLSLVEIGKRVHCEAVVSGLESDIYVGNCLLAMYSKFGDMDHARLLFDRMSMRDLTSWNTIISGYVKNGFSGEALGVFNFMGKSGLVPDSVTLLGLLSAIADLRMVKQGKALHGFVVRINIAGCENILINALIDMYSSCKFIVDAKRLFDASCKDTVSWNSLISGYARNENALESLRLFCQMVGGGQEPDLATFITVLEACEQITALNFGMAVHSYLLRKGFGSNIMTATALISMYSKCGNLTCSRCAFDEIEDKNLVSWSTMLAAYGHHGMGKEALSIFREMQENDIVPDMGAFASLLTACSHSGLVEEGQEIFHLLEQKYNTKPGLAQYSCLVDLLSRAGHLDKAYEIIENMKMKPTADMWASMLSACRVHGNVTLAELCAQKIFEADPQREGSYICLSQIYAAEERWNDVEKVRGMVSSKVLSKAPGCSFIE